MLLIQDNTVVHTRYPGMYAMLYGNNYVLYYKLGP